MERTGSSTEWGPRGRGNQNNKQQQHSNKNRNIRNHEAKFLKKTCRPVRPVCVRVCVPFTCMRSCHLMGPLRCGIVTMARKPAASSRQGTEPPGHQTNPEAEEPEAECPQWAQLRTHRQPGDAWPGQSPSHY